MKLAAVDERVGKTYVEKSDVVSFILRRLIRVYVKFILPFLSLMRGSRRRKYDFILRASTATSIHVVAVLPPSGFIPPLSIAVGRCVLKA